jgi:hypothetical protein
MIELIVGQPQLSDETATSRYNQGDPDERFISGEVTPSGGQDEAQVDFRSREFGDCVERVGTDTYKYCPG